MAELTGKNKSSDSSVLYKYHAFGMEIESQLAIPEFLISNANERAGLTIRLGSVPENLENAIFSGVRFQGTKGKFLLKVDKVARYLIQNGSEIIIEPTLDAEGNDIRLFLLGSAFGALFHQKGVLPVHGSAIVYKNKALIFSGISGAGKSTIAASFHKKDYPVITDDICMITLSDTNEPVIFPAYPQMKLWSDAIDKLGDDKSSLTKVRSGIQKFAVPFHEKFLSNPVTLAGIYIISTKNTPGTNLSTIKGIDKFNLIKNNTYRLNFIKGTGITATHFSHIEAIARLCFVKKVERPSKGFQLEELRNLIEEDFMRNIE
jgi:hypothetical protein